jgi:hypothetical protein
MQKKFKTCFVLVLRATDPMILDLPSIERTKLCARWTLFFWWCITWLRIIGWWFFPYGADTKQSTFADKVCIIRLDHISFEKSSSTFWQVRCCTHRTRRSCQKYDKDFFQIVWLSQKIQTLNSTSTVWIRDQDWKDEICKYVHVNFLIWTGYRTK